MSAENRIFVPRKSAQRSNTSSSVSSSASSLTSSTSVTSSSLANGIINGDSSYTTGTRKKSARSAWSASLKAESASSSANTRSQSMPPQMPAPVDMNTSVPPSAQPSLSRGSAPSNSPTGQLTEATTVLQLQPLNGTFDRKAVTIPYAPDVLRIGRQTNQKTIPTPNNGYFDSKVLSRQHAEVWSDRDGKISIRDVGSSNGTFVNGKRLSLENKPSEIERLTEGDILELGIDIVSEDQKTVVHHKVAARVDYAGFQDGPPSESMIGYGELESASFNGQIGRGRSQSQGPIVDTRHAGAVVSGAPGIYHAKWLQPVTMEQIVKRLNIELKQARNQSYHIQSNARVASALTEDMQSSRYFDAMPIQSRRVAESTRARYPSTPPAPPPSQPLPEAPRDIEVTSKAVEKADLPPLLRRTDTEKPRVFDTSNVGLASAKLENGSQILHLVEALSSAQKEIASQTRRLKEMEDALTTERQSRQIAEERITQLESTRAQSAANVEATSSAFDALAKTNSATTRTNPDLQQRIELMKLEMDEMKGLVAQYKYHAQVAEEDCDRDRQSLQAMIESITRREEATSRKAQTGQDQESAAKMKMSDDTSDAEVRDIEDELLVHVRRARERLQSASQSQKVAGVNKPIMSHLSLSELRLLGKAALGAALVDGSFPTHEEVHQQSDLLTNRSAPLGSGRPNQFVQSAPYASLIGVVLVGVGMMAYLNGWQKVLDR